MGKLVKCHVCFTEICIRNDWLGFVDFLAMSGGFIHLENNPPKQTMEPENGGPFGKGGSYLALPSSPGSMLKIEGVYAYSYLFRMSPFCWGNGSNLIC